MRKVARKTGSSGTSVHRQINKMQIKHKLRTKKPRYRDGQKKKAQKKSRKLVNQLYGSDNVVILDDEK